MAHRKAVVLILAVLCGAGVCAATYDPTWESIDARPLPAWYDQAKIGIFLHWGVFSVPSFRSEWFWNDWMNGNPQCVEFMKDNYPPDFQYQDFAQDFHAEFFDPDAWASIFAASGAKYVVLTSKHHEGFTNWPSKYSWNWNSVDVGPHKDLVGLLTTAVRAQNLTMGLYHSLFEWYHPLYLADKANNFTTQNFVNQVTMPQLHEIVEQYRPDVIWSDGDWEAPDTYWQSTEFLAWLYNSSPVKDTIVVNDRWGAGTSCKHGGYWSCADRYDPGRLIEHKWEDAFTLDTQSWGYRRQMNLSQLMPLATLLRNVVSVVACGGNVLINVGPTADGRIIPAFEERLRSLGSWLAVNGEAIYASSPWRVQNDSADIWYTVRANTLYATFFVWPQDSSLTLHTPIVDAASTTVSMLGFGPLKWQPGPSSTGLDIALPQLTPASPLSSMLAWTIALTNVK